jgi:hypothetical protein
MLEEIFLCVMLLPIAWGLIPGANKNVVATQARLKQLNGPAYVPTVFPTTLIINVGTMLKTRNMANKIRVKLAVLMQKLMS